LEEQQLHSSHVIKAEEFDFEYVGGEKKETFQRLNAFLSRSEHLNFVDTLALAAILDFLIHYYPRAGGAKRRARVLIPPGYLHPGKRKH
jgi:hypothetical protein